MPSIATTSSYAVFPSPADAARRASAASSVAASFKYCSSGSNVEISQRSSSVLCLAASISSGVSLKPNNSRSLSLEVGLEGRVAKPRFGRLAASRNFAIDSACSFRNFSVSFQFCIARLGVGPAWRSPAKLPFG